jgi:protein-S-isoprenylcysteine O-methyltransferase Ste14
MSPLLLPRVVRSLLVLALDVALLALGLGGLSALLHEPRALALLAAWGIGGAVLAARAPVRGGDNVGDIVAVDKDPGAMLLLFFAPLLAPLTAALGAQHHLWMLPGAPAWGWAGVTLAVLGFALRIAAMSQLGARFSPLVAVQREHALETRGLYGVIRHPGYLGALLGCLGSAIAFDSALALPLFALMLGAELARVQREELLLARHFGEAWREYAARTGALLPRALGGR